MTTPTHASLVALLERRLHQAEAAHRTMCSCSCGCEASGYYESAANWPECNCWCHIPMWKKRLQEAQSNHD